MQERRPIRLHVPSTVTLHGHTARRIRNLWSTKLSVEFAPMQVPGFVDRCAAPPMSCSSMHHNRHVHVSCLIQSFVQGLTAYDLSLTGD